MQKVCFLSQKEINSKEYPFLSSLINSHDLINEMGNIKKKYSVFLIIDNTQDIENIIKKYELDKKDNNYYVVFTVALTEKIALNSFNISIIGFFEKTVQKFITNKIKKTRHKGIYFKVKNRLEKLLFNDIEWIQARDVYSVIKTSKGRYLISNTLKEIEDKLMPYPNFQRIQRSHLVNLNKIEAIENKEVLISGEYIAIGQSYKEQFFEKLLLM